jgi:hypothetical protein
MESTTQFYRYCVNENFSDFILLLFWFCSVLAGALPKCWHFMKKLVQQSANKSLVGKHFHENFCRIM